MESSTMMRNMALLGRITGATKTLVSGMGLRRREAIEAAAGAVVEGLESRRLLTISPVIPSAALIQTTLGQITVEMTPEATPITVANFQQYVTAGRYDQTIIHRSTHVETDGLTIIQGGGYKVSDFS